MENLSKVPDCDMYIQSELEEAGINICRAESGNSGEVPWKIFGKSINSRFTFKRAWSYYVVKGDIPQNIQRIITNEVTLQTNGDLHIFSQKALCSFAEIFGK
ncbi:hypothetical protein COV49_03265 [Candidatus Falkowbacteria bacterium CG11_big_fil_rev_8_21_14_0_20_39_10]|uniref:Uncharacterized protein n=1 Tax=Candidatus Falkowbacteria bacterium CG11_big_fil_rev_8_21_14_0_20_39_10 TaxID=1974570 RepID=A0A2M6K8U3_9BACT|nr:MAG: hypothetical protein COV49_03265 [Candidatus Falkowbacteria bacterium CG11_big_fil_rev_8_21_14_0_20_39_10]